MDIDDVKRICVVGSGIMGSQIAMQCALHGYNVMLHDLTEELLSDLALLGENVGRIALLADLAAKPIQLEVDVLELEQEFAQSYPSSITLALDASLVDSCFGLARGGEVVQRQSPPAPGQGPGPPQGR